MRRLPASREVAILAGLTALAAVVRFVGIGTQSYWYDEALTVRLVRLPFGDMLSAFPKSGAEPPLYFLLAWPWTHIFGFGEVGLRSLSAVAGTLTVPGAYLAARQLVGRRGAFAAAALTALSPPLVWYSQEARSYSLMTLLCAVSMLFFLKALNTAAKRDLALWVLASVLAVTAHYFAAFLIMPEVVWLLARSADRRRALGAVGALVVAGAALAPLALYQRKHGGADWIGHIALRPRVDGAVHFFAVGPSGPRLSAPLLYGGSLLSVVVILTLLRRADEATRRGALLAGALAVAVIAIPLVAKIAGTDFFLDRNVMAAWVPLAIVAAAGLMGRHARKLGLAVLAGVCVAFLVINLRIPGDPALQRDDWREVARLLGPPRSDRVIAVAPGWQTLPLAFYTARLSAMPTTATVTEVDTITYDGTRAYNEPVFVTPPGGSFRRLARVTTQRMTLTRYVASRPTPISGARLVGRGDNASAPFLQRAE